MRSKFSIWTFRLAFLSLVLTVVACPAGGVRVSQGSLTLPTYPWWPAIRHPYFQETDQRNIYPYPMLDQLSREKQPRTYRTVVMENEYLKVTLIPELGGRVHEVLEKHTGKQVFYVNQVIKPGLIGQCGAWISGGIEWNTGPQGHTVSCMLPVSVVPLPEAPDGSRSVAIGETERIYGTRWTVVLTLRPGRSFLEESIRIYNPTPMVRPYYFWNCTAVPNTSAFRFIYPMTLGCDHNGDEFYTWPMAKGKDLSRGTNYQDASSIFAWHCDQDFFGSYDDAADRGVVSCADHHQLPGKKAWTWGYGGFGTLHQADLTDDGSRYNEVQTGPLLTQAEVGRLEPHEAVAWQEWWYPVRQIGGFTYANRELAANVTREHAPAAGAPTGNVRVRLLPTAKFSRSEIRLRRGQELLARSDIDFSPDKPADLLWEVPNPDQSFQVDITADKRVLASFRSPLDLPVRHPPEKKKKSPDTASELTQSGWRHYLFARYPEAEKDFKAAVEQDKSSAEAHAGLACLKLESDPLAAVAHASNAVTADPDYGPGQFVLAAGKSLVANNTEALAAAWQAALDPRTATAGRALAARLLIADGRLQEAADLLGASGPWESDPLCRNRLAFTHWRLGERKRAITLAQASLAADPLDPFARSILWLAKAEKTGMRLAEIAADNPYIVTELAAEFVGLKQSRIALSILEHFYVEGQVRENTNPIPFYWAAWLALEQSRSADAERYGKTAAQLSADAVFPHGLESIPALRAAVQMNPKDGKAALYFGHLLFSLGRLDEGRALWRRAAELNAVPAIANRALGMASLELEKNSELAEKYLQQAHAADPTDAIVARDLAKVLYARASRLSADEKTNLLARARDILQQAFAQGRTRSDYVGLLARSYNSLGDHANTARLLDTVRITVWEGAREAHDLFEASHLALGRAHMEAGRAEDALKEFDRALEYPANLATGRMENAREAHIHFLRGQVLATLGRAAEARAAWEKAANEPASKDPEKEEARRKARAALGQ